jgi:hypothetical protein
MKHSKQGLSVFAKRLTRTVSCALAISLAASSTQAGTAVCSGTISSLSWHQPGLVFLRLSSMNAPYIVCDLAADHVVPGAIYQVTTPAQCKTLLAQLLTAQAANRPVGAVYFDGDAVNPSCSDVPNWVRASLRHFSIG